MLRLAFGLLYWTGKPLTHDEQRIPLARAKPRRGPAASYDDAALETARAQQFGRAPGYPLFLAAIGAGSADGTSHGTPLR